MVRNSLRFVSWKDYKAVTRDLKTISGPYGRSRRWMRSPLPWTAAIRSRESNWANLSTFFVYPADLRKIIDTTNAIASLKSVIRHAIKKRKVFPTGDAVNKVMWLAIQAVSLR